MEAVAPLINLTFEQFESMFGRKYTSRFGDINKINATKRTWAIAFIKEKITKAQIKYALEQVLYMRMQWPPELIEFLTLCDHEVVTGIPNNDDAAQIIMECNTKYRHSQEEYKAKRLHHPILQYLNQQCAQHVNRDESSYKKLFSREYKRAVMLFKSGTLPQTNKALPAPQIEHSTKGYCFKNPDDPLAQRVAQMGRLLKEKQ